MAEAFRSAGERHGYESISAEFVAFKQFKVQWQRSYKWISFRVSDYLADAPECVLSDLAETLFSKIEGKETGYSEAMREWVLDDSFCREKRPVFLRRGRYLSKGPAGKERDLSDSLRRLAEAGLIDADDDIQAVWNRDSRNDFAATYSVLMRTVMVSDSLDNNEIPDFVLDYVIYRQCLMIEEGRMSFGRTEPCDIGKDGSLFERHEEAERILNKLCLAL
ncbi:MAG: hypothetical protein ACI4Q9_03900 [Candidatus Methanomethylophilaceae archaeon]